MRACLALLVAGSAASAVAAASPGSPVQQSFQVSAAIVAGCAIATSGGSAWGTIDLGTIAGVGTASASASLVSPTGAGLQLNCTPGLTVSITADNGLYAAGGVRQLGRAGGSQRLPYQLFANGSATAWTTQAVTLSFPAGTSQIGLPISASVSASAPRAAGTYSDTVSITVSW